MMMTLSRRQLGASLLFTGAASFADSRLLARSPGLGERLYADVQRYHSMGEHRTASAADRASGLWLADRLRASGYRVRLPAFSLATFDPKECWLTIGGERIEAFPAWPVVPVDRLTAELRSAAEPGSLAGTIALLILPYRQGAAFVVRDYGSAVLEAQARGAAAIAVVTEGPTGEIVALNAHLTRYAWRVPVVLIAGKEGARLRALAARRLPATVRVAGTAQPRAVAANVLAERPALTGSGPGTIVLTTPKSGWFGCAGERGSGIALFLDMAAVLARLSRRRILAVATSGHELEGLGGEALVDRYAPEPRDVHFWTHVGANVASNMVDLSRGVRRLTTIHPQRGILVPSDLMASAASAFAGQPGYERPVDILSDRAIGEVVIYRREGYHRLAGLVGGHPLHHTRLDTPANATSPQALQPVAEGLARFARLIA